MASFAAESLSPLLKNTSFRRRSLDFCQKFGSQLLSPSSPVFSASHTSPKTDHGSASSSSTSPFKTTETFRSSISTWTAESSETLSFTNKESQSKRRASDSLRIDSFAKIGNFQENEGSHGRRSSFTPQDSGGQYSSLILMNNPVERCDITCDTDNCEQASKDVFILRSEVICNIIPPTPSTASKVQKIEQSQCNEHILELGSTSPPLLQHSLELEYTFSSDGGISDDDDGGRGKVGQKEPFSTFHQHKFDKTTNFFFGDSIPPRSTVRRRSVGARYDLDDNLISQVATKWNLSLNPNELLGKGSFGTVIAGSFQGKAVAVKILKTTSSQRKASVKGEENALGLKFHNHIAHIIDILQMGPDTSLIIMEKMEKGNLLSLLNDSRFDVDYSVAINFSKQIALALMFCHRHGLLHLDVKPQNILVDINNCCKLSDFGSSKKIADLNNSYKYSTLEGTVPYTAPEMFKGQCPTEKSDVFGLAITMWQIITRELPYQDENEHAVIFRMQGALKFNVGLQQVVSQGLRPSSNAYLSMEGSGRFHEVQEKFSKIYQQAWHSNPKVRPSMTDIHMSLLKLQFLNEVPRLKIKQQHQAT